MISILYKILLDKTKEANAPFRSHQGTSVQPLVLHQLSCLGHHQAEEEHGEGEANGRGVQDFALEKLWKKAGMRWFCFDYNIYIYILMTKNV